MAMAMFQNYHYCPQCRAVLGVGGRGLPLGGLLASLSSGEAVPLASTNGCSGLNPQPVNYPAKAPAVSAGTRGEESMMNVET
jgi:hypothetical protein